MKKSGARRGHRKRRAGGVGTDGRRGDERQPWLGLRTYLESDRDQFFGRTSEIYELYSFLRQNEVAVLFGRSGRGKSSLLNAGLFPLLRRKGYFPLRVALDYSSDDPDLVAQVHAVIDEGLRSAPRRSDDSGSPLEESEESRALPLAVEGETLWEHVHRACSLWHELRITPVLVFDQFEDVFRRGTADDRRVQQTRRLIRELAWLLENQVPGPVERRLEHSDDPALPFPFEVRRFKALVTLREDFLPHLEELVRLIPSLRGQNRVRLGPLSRKGALEAIRKPAPDLVSADVAGRILEAITRHREPNARTILPSEEGDGSTAIVEPFLLSLFCREINEARIEQAQERITEEQVEASAEEILREFYLGCVDGLGRNVRLFVENELVDASGYREIVPVTRAQGAKYRVEKEQLQELIARRLLRFQGESQEYVELVHDVLADAILKERVQREAWERRGRFWKRAFAFVLSLFLLVLGIYWRLGNVRTLGGGTSETIYVHLAPSGGSSPVEWRLRLGGQPVPAGSGARSQGDYVPQDFEWEDASGYLAISPRDQELVLTAPHAEALRQELSQDHARVSTTVLGTQRTLLETVRYRIPVTIVRDDKDPEILADRMRVLSPGGAERKPGSFIDDGSPMRLRKTATLEVSVRDFSECRLVASSSEISVVKQLRPGAPADGSGEKTASAPGGDDLRTQTFVLGLEELESGRKDINLTAEDQAGNKSGRPLSFQIDDEVGRIACRPHDALYVAGKAYVPFTIPRDERLAAMSLTVGPHDAKARESQSLVVYGRETVDTWAESRRSSQPEKKPEPIAVPRPAPDALPASPRSVATVLESGKEYFFVVNLPPEGDTCDVIVHASDNAFPRKAEMFPLKPLELPAALGSTGLKSVRINDEDWRESETKNLRLDGLATANVELKLDAPCDRADCAVGEAARVKGSVDESGKTVTFERLELQPNQINRVLFHVSARRGGDARWERIVFPDTKEPEISELVISQRTASPSLDGRVGVDIVFASSEEIPERTVRLSRDETTPVVLPATWEVEGLTYRARVDMEEGDSTLVLKATDRAGWIVERTKPISINLGGPRIQPDSVPLRFGSRRSSVNVEITDLNGVGPPAATIEVDPPGGAEIGARVDRIVDSDTYRITPTEDLAIPTRGRVIIQVEDMGNPQLGTTQEIPFELDPKELRVEHAGIIWIRIPGEEKPFYISRTEIPNEVYRKFVRRQPSARPKYWPESRTRCEETGQLTPYPCYVRGKEHLEGDRFPVVGVSPEIAECFAKSIDDGARLPTRDEWLRAARLNHPYDDSPGRAGGDGWGEVNIRLGPEMQDLRTDCLLWRGKRIPCHHVEVDKLSVAEPRAYETRVIHLLGNVREMVSGEENESADYYVVGGFYDTNTDSISPGRRPTPYEARLHRSITTGIRLVIDLERASDAFLKKATGVRREDEP